MLACDSLRSAPVAEFRLGISGLVEVHPVLRSGGLVVLNEVSFANDDFSESPPFR